MIDTHAHLNFKDFEKDYQKIISRSFDNGVTAIINVGSNFETSKRACEIAKEFSEEKIGIFAAVGLHPIHAKDENFVEEKYVELIKNKVYLKAIGETGLDYFHLAKEEEKIKDKQKEIFIKQLNLAKKFDLPIIIHSRSTIKHPEKSYLDILKILDNLEFSSKGVIHCFPANWQIAKKFLKRDFYLGFNGTITFPNWNYKEVIKNTPLEKILLETDCPYLAPQAVRGTRNEPKNLFYIAKEMAKIKNEPMTKIIKTTDQNAQKFFNLI